jgi:hypothetical protein
MVSVSFMSGSVSTSNKRNLFSNKKNNKYYCSNSKSSTTTTAAQLSVLNTVEQNYSLLLSEKKYEQIQSNYTVFLNLLKTLRSINVYDVKLSLLIKIAENALVGSMNVNTLYSSYAYNEIKIALLNKRIEDILSNKNVIETIASTSSTMVASKTIKLSPIFSYYIYLYGCPVYGVGFDASKLSFIKNLPFFKGDGSINALCL